MVSVRTQTAVIAVIFAAATCVLAGRHGGRGGFENELPRPTFLQGLNRTDVRAFYQIALNQNLTRNQINTELSSWASNQTTEIQSEFNTWTANVSSAISQIVEKSDAIAANLSSDAQTLYDEIKAVRSNNDLTGLQQCNETQTILRNASSTVARELFRAIPQVAGPPCRPGGGRHGGRHGGFGGRHGGFGGNQGGFGGFGGSQGGFGGNQGGFGGNQGGFGGNQGGFGGNQGGFGGFGGSQGGFGGNQGGFGGFGGSQGGFGGNQGGFGSNQNGFGSLGRFSGGQNDFPGNQGDFGAFGGNSRF